MTFPPPFLTPSPRRPSDRPPSAAPPPRTRVWHVATAFLACAAAGALGPLRSLDALLQDAFVAALGPRPVPSVVVLRTSAADLRDADCPSRLARLLDLSGARGALLLPPVGAFCAASEPTTAAGRPIVALAPGSLRFGIGKRVVGVRPEADDAPLARLGLRATTAARAPLADDLPSLAFADVAGRHFDPAVLRDKVAVVAMPGELDLADHMRADDAASAAAALLGSGGRKPAPAWASGLLVLALGAALAAVARLGRPRPTPRVALAAVAALVATQAALVALTVASLLPIGSLLVAAALAFSLPSLRRLRSRRWALARAVQLMGQARQLEPAPPATEPASDFFRKLSDVVAQNHPADFTFFGELEGDDWHLRLWPEGPPTADLMRERRRDVRRPPYVDPQGVLRPQLLFNFLADPALPVLLVPLIASGELEGYAFLCGPSARQAFEADATRAPRLGERLATLLRARRLTSSSTGPTAKGVGTIDRSLSFDPNESAYGLLAGATKALKGLGLFETIVREAPVGLLYADAFGDVRAVSRTLAELFPPLGVASEGQVSLPAGELTLVCLLGALTGRGPAEAADVIASLPRRTGDVTLSINLPKGGAPRPYALRLRALRGDDDVRSTIAGYVAVLTDARADLERTGHWLRPPSPPAEVSPAPTGLTTSNLRDGLALSLQQVERRAGWRPRAELERAAVPVVHRPALFDALASFLAASRALPGPEAAPISVSVQRRRGGVDVVIAGLASDLPPSLLRAVVDTPHLAPPELAPLATLVATAREGHGLAQIVPMPQGYALLIALLPAQLSAPPDPLFALPSAPPPSKPWAAPRTEATRTPWPGSFGVRPR